MKKSKILTLTLITAMMLVGCGKTSETAQSEESMKQTDQEEGDFIFEITDALTMQRSDGTERTGIVGEVIEGEVNVGDHIYIDLDWLTLTESDEENKSTDGIYRANVTITGIQMDNEDVQEAKSGDHAEIFIGNYCGEKLESEYIIKDTTTGGKRVNGEIVDSFSGTLHMYSEEDEAENYLNRHLNQELNQENEIWIITQNGDSVPGFMEAVDENESVVEIKAKENMEIIHGSTVKIVYGNLLFTCGEVLID